MSSFYVDATAGDIFVLIDWNDEKRYNDLYMEKKGFVYIIIYGNHPDNLTERLTNVHAPYKHNNLIKGLIYYYKLVGVDKDGNVEESYLLDATPGNNIGISFLSRKVIEDG